MKRRDLLKWIPPAVVVVTLPAHAYTSIGGAPAPSIPFPDPVCETVGELVVCVEE